MAEIIDGKLVSQHIRDEVAEGSGKAKEGNGDNGRSRGGARRG